MRMWNVSPARMCRNHLLGEHLEMHMFAGSINKGSSIKGYVCGGLVEPNKIKKRHDNLAVEMKKRGYVHKSPLSSSFLRKYRGICGYVSAKNNEKELARRCKACRKLLK